MSSVLKPNLATLLFLISFGSVGAVIYTPALPDIARHFGVTAGAAQLTVTAYLVGYALGQLPYGPVSNRLGRKPTIYIGSAVGLLGVILCIVADLWQDTFWLFNVGRVMSALGLAVGLVMTFTLIGDSFNRQESRRVISLATLAFAVMPGVAVAIGGFLTHYIGWQACFYFLGLYSLFVWWLASRLPETGPGIQYGSLHIAEIGRGYWSQLKDPRVVLGGIIIGCGTSLIYLFAAKAPFIAMEVIGLAPDVFGLLNLSAFAGAAGGSLLSSWLSHHIAPVPFIILGFTIIGLSSVAQLLLFFLGIVNPWTLFLPMAVLGFGIVFEYSAITALITSSATDKSHASALMSFLNMGIPTLAVLSAGILYPLSPLSLPLFFTILIALMVILFAALELISRSKTA